MGGVKKEREGKGRRGEEERDRERESYVGEMGSTCEEMRWRTGMERARQSRGGGNGRWQCNGEKRGKGGGRDRGVKN